MTIEIIHFVLDSFKHFMPEDEVDGFIRGIVGKWGMLMPEEDNQYDEDCIEGYFAH